MWCCSKRCLFGFAIFIGGLFVTYPILFPVPDGIEKEDREKIRLISMVFKTGFFVGRLSQVFGYENRYALMQNRLLATRQAVSDVEQDPIFEVNNLGLGEGIRVRIWKKKSSDKSRLQPAIIYLHGGGWVLGAPELFEDSARILIEGLTSDVIIIGVRYNLAPKHPYPRPFFDCFQATTYILRNGESMGIDPTRVSIMGSSAGGNLAAAVALKLQTEKDLPKLKLQILLYPPLQAFDFNTPSYQNPDSGIIISKATMLSFLLSYGFGKEDDLDIFMASNHTSPTAKKSLEASYVSSDRLPGNFVPKDFKPVDKNMGDEAVWKRVEGVILSKYFAPLMASDEDLLNLPQTYIVSAQFDPLRDDAFFYTRRLKKAGVDVTHMHYPSTIHGFLDNPVRLEPGKFTCRLKASKQAFHNLIDYLRLNI